MQLSQLMASLHPVMVHFPIALLFAAVVMDLVAFWRKDERLAYAAMINLIAGTVGIMLSFTTGNMAIVWAARQQVTQPPLKLHENFAQFTSWAFIALVALRSFVHVRRNRPYFAVYLLCGALSLGMLAATGWLGGELVYKYGAGVALKAPPIPPTDVDLANLSLELDDTEVAYSEQMHRVFGWMVLGMTFWLLYDNLKLPYAEKVRALGPILLVGGGVFLMVFSDHDAWPIGNLKPITDAEVLAHKIIAAFMIFIGSAANLVRRKSAEAGRLQHHLVAILALVGGGMLFTHLHTAAPYADSAIGVYLHHFFLAGLALSCGAIKMLELLAPEGNKIWKATWIVLLFLIAAALITYTESMPFWLEGT
ncbi:DUF2231 domain-containing protein [bacterium CPR1]|nr:DUF2231 domain-containing protein [bacterium CPR1]